MLLATELSTPAERGFDEAVPKCSNRLALVLFLPGRSLIKNVSKMVSAPIHTVDYRFYSRPFGNSCQSHLQGERLSGGTALRTTSCGPYTARISVAGITHHPLLFTHH
jgi:hypothetical protein